MYAALPLLVLAVAANPPAIRYEPLAAWPDVELDAASVDAAFAEAITALPRAKAAPLFEGWISTSIWTRLEADRQIFLVRRGPPLAPDRRLCRVTVADPLRPGGNADASAGIARLGWGCDQARDDDVRAAALWAISAAPQPQVMESADFATSDGRRVRVDHVTRAGLWLAPLPPSVDPRAAAIGRLPTSRALAEDATLTRWFVRDRSGTPGARWGLAIKYGAGLPLGRSGCYMTAIDGGAAPPGGTWLTPAILAWCGARQQNWAKTQPRPPIPVPAPRRP